MGLDMFVKPTLTIKKIDKNVGMYMPVLWMVFLETNGNQHRWRKLEVVVLEVSRLLLFGGLEIFLGPSVLKYTHIYTVYIYT